jgi:lipoate-protein ligase A
MIHLITHPKGIMLNMKEQGTTIWRLIITPPSPGAWNMALDEAFLESTSEGIFPPTLRLYAWSPPCISLGYAQPSSQVDIRSLQELNWDIVRRSTGGRAILHTDELTYSVSAPLDNPHFAGGVLESYKHISQGLVQALQIMQLKIEIQPEVKLTSDEREQPICFEIPSSYEITAGGKKLIGSAQVRRRGGVLQHGTLPLNGDIARICQVLSFPDQESRELAARRLRERATTIEQLLNISVSWEEAADAVKSGFQSALGLRLEQAEPTKDERLRAEELAEEKFNSEEWTNRLP